ncbi:hypothetical protein YPPY42_1142, partial [Yersinia pestis PY-42]
MAILNLEGEYPP